MELLFFSSVDGWDAVLTSPHLRLEQMHEQDEYGRIAVGRSTE